MTDRVVVRLNIKVKTAWIEAAAEAGIDGMGRRKNGMMGHPIRTNQSAQFGSAAAHYERKAVLTGFYRQA